MSAPFTGPDAQPGDLVAVQMPDGELRTELVGAAAPKWLRDVVESYEKNAVELLRAAGLPADLMHPTIATTVSEIDALKAENAALRDELETLQQTHVGEVVAHNEELFAEVQQLRATVARLEAK